LSYLDTEEFLNKASCVEGFRHDYLGPLLAQIRSWKTYPSLVVIKSAEEEWTPTSFGFQKLGAEFHYDSKKEIYYIDGKNLKGAYMLLDEASVTGTANIVMAAVHGGRENHPFTMQHVSPISATAL
jgi:UDP-N-acetylglucosamine 1-carboxyvinyltransferase